MFEQFVELQDHILAIVDRAEAILRDPGNRDTAALGQARWQAARALRQYQLFKHSRIFDPIAAGQDFRALKARRMKEDCIRFGEGFHEYVLRWSVVSIPDNWEEFHVAALASIARIRAQLAKERAGVAELLDVKSEAA
jgi:hypothetical protein